MKSFQTLALALATAALAGCASYRGGPVESYDVEPYDRDPYFSDELGQSPLLQPDESELVGSNVRVERSAPDIARPRMGFE